MSADSIHGRGTGSNPKNRFVALDVLPDPDAPPDDGPAPATIFFRDTTRTAIATNDSPDIGFEASINPYRGCEHGCIYCYARPFHEFLGFSAGLDFETRIMVKNDLPVLLRKELSSRKWKPKTISISGVTDAYQPVERRLRITRACLEILAEFGNPVGIVTKSALVKRDADILAPMAAKSAAAVCLSITTLNNDLAGVMEPRASSPRARLDAIRELSAAGIPTGVMLAPLIPGLNDTETSEILSAAAEAGAKFAAYTLVRLPLAVADLFQDWLTQHFPDRKEKILNRIRDLRGGKLNESEFGKRFAGVGIWDEQIRSLFELSARRAGLSLSFPRLSTSGFRLPDSLALGAGPLGSRGLGQPTLF
jgi:DNA repair photolyase